MYYEDDGSRCFEIFLQPNDPHLCTCQRQVLIYPFFFVWEAHHESRVIVLPTSTSLRLCLMSDATNGYTAVPGAYPSSSSFLNKRSPQLL